MVGRHRARDRRRAQPGAAPRAAVGPAPGSTRCGARRCAPAPPGTRPAGARVSAPPLRLLAGAALALAGDRSLSRPMIPLKDTIPSRTAPVVTVALIAVNVLVFLHETALGPHL